GADDFAIRVNEDKETGFLSSNREGGEGKDDIYSFYMKPLAFNLTLIVKDSKTGEPVEEALIEFKINTDSSVQLRTNKQGELILPLMNKSSYRFFASKAESYYLDSKLGEVATVGKEMSEDFRQELFLTPINVEDEFTLKGIYYDLD